MPAGDVVVSVTFVGLAACEAQAAADGIDGALDVADASGARNIFCHAFGKQTVVFGDSALLEAAIRF